MLTDQGKNFECELVKSLCDLLQMRKLRTSSYHPQGNGQTERYNATRCDMLRSYENAETWEEMLQWAASAFNTSVHACTGYTPHELVYGTTPQGAVIHEAQGARDQDQMKTYATYDADLRHEVRKKTEEALENLNKGVRKRTQERTGGGFAVGSFVMIKHLRRQQKLQPLWQGPFEVIQVDRPDFVILRGENRYKIHGALLKAWKGDDKADDETDDSQEDDGRPR